MALNHERIAALVKELLGEIGEDPEREGLRKTPARGVEKQNSGFVTSALLGSFRESASTHSKFLSLLSRPRPDI